MTFLAQAALTQAASGQVQGARARAGNARALARRTVTKQTPGARSWVCGSCDTPLIPGINVKARVRSGKRSHHVVMTCIACGAHTRSSSGRQDDKRGKNTAPAKSIRRTKSTQNMIKGSKGELLPEKEEPAPAVSGMDVDATLTMEDKPVV